MSRCSSLNQARAYWSAKYSGSRWKRSEMARNSGSAMRATSVVAIIVGHLAALDVRVVARSSGCTSLARHCLAPAGLSVSSHSYLKSRSK
jgi:hypothetical protein